MNVNLAVIEGRLGRDIELKYTKNGTAMASFSVAVNRRVKQQDGSYETYPIWIPVKLWDKKAENAQRYCHKGDLVYIKGFINHYDYEDKDGKKQYRTEIVGEEIQFPPKKDGGGYGQNDGYQQGGNAPARGRQSRDWSPDDQPMDVSDIEPAQNFSREDADIPF